MSVVGAIFVIVAAIMLVAVLVTLHLSLRRQDQVVRVKLTAQNKMLSQDNVETNQRNQELAGKLEWYRKIFFKTEDILFVHRVSDDLIPENIVDANDVTCARLQRTREELMKMSPMELGYDAEAASAIGYSTTDMFVMSDSAVKERQKRLALRPAQNLMKKIVENEETVFERKFVAKDGSEFPVEVRARSFRVDGKTFVAWTAHDTTTRKEAEEALHESEVRLRNFFEHSPIGVAMYDGDKALVNVNLAFLRVMGIPDREQFKKFDIFKNPFVPEHIREKVRTGESVRFELDLNFDMARKRSMFISTRTGNARFDMMISNMGRDKDFNPRGYLVQVQDNTQRHEAEVALQQSERQLRQAEKMEAIGSMAGGIAHDFNNILTPILGYTELVLRMSKDNEQLNTFMEEIMKAGHRAKDLVNQILTFSRQKEKDGQPIRVVPIVKEVLNLMRASLPESIVINRMIKTEHDVVIADPTQIHQVLMNLCTNAWHAMKEKSSGTLEVRISDFLHERGSKGRMPEMASGRYIQISVCDTGVGMTKSTLDHIFEPFFTTKKSGEGTGMGLSVVRNIVTSFKGTVLVDTETGKGSEFHVILPSVEDDIMDKLQLDSGPLKSGTETVLLVDDDPSIVEMVSRMLETLGYKPVTAKLGREALDILRKEPEKFDIVLTDQVMPGMLGRELATEIFAIRPELPIVLCTGFSESFSLDDAKAAGVTDFLKKPIIMRELADVLRRSIDAKHGKRLESGS